MQIIGDKDCAFSGRLPLHFEVSPVSNPGRGDETSYLNPHNMVVKTSLVPLVGGGAFC